MLTTAKVEAWRRAYDESRPYTEFGHVPPAELAAWNGAKPFQSGILLLQLLQLADLIDFQASVLLLPPNEMDSSSLYGH